VAPSLLAEGWLIEIANIADDEIELNAPVPVLDTAAVRNVMLGENRARSDESGCLLLIMSLQPSSGSRDSGGVSAASKNLCNTERPRRIPRSRSSSPLRTV